jgi:lipopolysaccharide transport system ATP-binding protein
MKLLQLLRRFFGKEKSQIIILDDYFPNVLTGFRVAEYNAYLAAFPDLKIYSTYPDFQAAHSKYSITYPHFSQRISPYNASVTSKTKLVYINFLNNAHRFLDDLEKNHTPFILNLYPGGGFDLNDEISDDKLKRVLSSKLLRHVITTQSVTTDYLKRFTTCCPVTEIYGVVIDSSIPSDAVNRSNERDTDDLRICFVAQKYMPLGSNKGYPEFIETLCKLYSAGYGFTASVVGNFAPTDINLDQEVRAKIRWLGNLTTAELKVFFSQQDVIVSPNKPFTLSAGNFDGFPTGACVEASLCGVALVCSDPLLLNKHFAHGRDLIICEPNSDAVVEALLPLMQNKSLCRMIGQNGSALCRELFSKQVQIDQRIDIIMRYVNET